MKPLNFKFKKKKKLFCHLNLFILNYKILFLLFGVFSICFFDLKEYFYKFFLKGAKLIYKFIKLINF